MFPLRWVYQRLNHTPVYFLAIWKSANWHHCHATVLKCRPTNYRPFKPGLTWKGFLGILFHASTPLLSLRQHTPHTGQSACMLQNVPSICKMTKRSIFDQCAFTTKRSQTKPIFLHFEKVFQSCFQFLSWNLWKFLLLTKIQGVALLQWNWCISALQLSSLWVRSSQQRKAATALSSFNGQSDSGPTKTQSWAKQSCCCRKPIFQCHIGSRKFLLIPLSSRVLIAPVMAKMDTRHATKQAAATEMVSKKGKLTRETCHAIHGF